MYKRAATTETKLNECEAITHPPEGSPGMRSGRLSDGASDLQTELREGHALGWRFTRGGQSRARARLGTMGTVT